jgi:hypothetical protein
LWKEFGNFVKIFSASAFLNNHWNSKRVLFELS